VPNLVEGLADVNKGRSAKAFVVLDRRQFCVLFCVLVRRFRVVDKIQIDEKG
jgi:hypothetical protein